MDVLRIALDTAKKSNISTIVVASTTGKTALKLLDLVKGESFEIIVVTHDEGRPLEKRRFDENTRLLLLANNITVYTHNPSWLLLQKIIRKILKKLGLSGWQRHLADVKARYGTGIKVCHIILKMLSEANMLREGRVITIAGKKSGADSVAIFSVKSKNKWPILEKVVLNPST